MALALRILTGWALLTLLLHCEPAPASAPENAPENQELGPNAALIRNPVDQGDGRVDTVNVAKMTFAEGPRYRFGEARQGELVTHQFRFTNTGRVPLLITSARSTCGCTVPSYPETPVAPGESGLIDVVFDTKNKTGRQVKAVTLHANTYPATTTLFVEGAVTED